MRLAKIRLGRILSQADLHAVLAAGCECTSLGRIQKIHRITLDGDQLLMLRAVQTGDGVYRESGFLIVVTDSRADDSDFFRRHVHAR